MAPLEISNLSIDIAVQKTMIHAVRDVSLTVQEGEILVLAGESGSGKSVLCKSILKLLPREAVIRQGGIRVHGEDVVSCTEKQMQAIRGRQVAMAFQNPLTILNPSMTMGAQFRESICRHNPALSRQEADAMAIEYLQLVGIKDGKYRLDMLPHAFSGGQRQRCALAIALAGKPDILIADEPTTALDVTVQVQILDLLKKLQQKMKLSVLFVTHDLGVAEHIADRIGIMYAGKLVETGTAQEIFHDARHPYTWGLLSSVPAMAEKGKPLHCIQGMPPDLSRLPAGDAFAPRNPYALAIDYRQEAPLFAISDTHKAATWLLDPRAPQVISPVHFSAKGQGRNRLQPMMAVTTKDRSDNGKPELLRTEGLSKAFRLDQGHGFYAVKDVSLVLHEDEILGLVGESGCGKSTVARMIINICQPTAGKIFFRGQELAAGCRPRAVCQQMQMIFQDSDGALNPRMTAGQSVAEGLLLSGQVRTRPDIKARLDELFAAVELSPRCQYAYPAELSGGQRQRVAIARCLGINPKLIIADEPIAALDVSIQAQIINLLCRLQQEQHFSMIFIAHDLFVVHYLSHRIAVMHDGQIIEEGAAEKVYFQPEKGYTKELLSSVLCPC